MFSDERRIARVDLRSRGRSDSGLEVDGTCEIRKVWGMTREVGYER